MNLPIRKSCDSDIKFEKLLGKGGDAEVYKVNYKGRNYAAKISMESNYLTEIDISSRIESEYLMHSCGIIWSIPPNSDIPKQTILYELANQSLISCDISKYTIKKRISLCYQLAKAVEVLHSSDILHLDIKPSNVLIFGRYPSITVKLADFGYCLYSQKSGRRRLSRRIWTGGYRAPELLDALRREYSTKNDIWSLGLTFAYLIGGESLTVPRSSKDVIEKFGKRKIKNTIDNCVISNIPKEDGIIIRGARDLLNNMLKYEPKDRPRISGVISHDLFCEDKDYSFEPKESRDMIWEMEDGGRFISMSNCKDIDFEPIISLFKQFEVSTEIVFLSITLYFRILMILETGKDIRDRKKKIVIETVNMKELEEGKTDTVKIMLTCSRIAMKTFLLNKNLPENSDSFTESKILQLLEFKINVKTPYYTNFLPCSIVKAYKYLLQGKYYVTINREGKDEYLSTIKMPSESIIEVEDEYRIFSTFNKLMDQNN